MGDMNDRTIRAFTANVGRDAANDFMQCFDEKIESDSPHLTGTIILEGDVPLAHTVAIGAGPTDLVGAFGAAPIAQPAGADQAPLPPDLFATLGIGVGMPGGAIVDVGDPPVAMTINNNFATVADLLNQVVETQNTMRQLVSRLRDDLVALGWIKGGP